MTGSAAAGHVGATCARVGDFDVIECEACGFRHLLPIPTPEQLENVYRHEYYSQEKPLYLERTREDRPWTDLVYDERYGIFESLLPAGSRSLLDIGSGPGFFLLRGKERGWRTLGVEPSRQSAAHSRGLGLDVVEEFLDVRVAAGLGTFDVVHLSQVLEHIPDPRAMLKLVRGLVRPGGLACVVVPNDFNPFQVALRDHCGFAPWWVAPPHHINFFDFGSLGRLLEDCGFVVVERDTTFPIDMFLLMGENYVGNDELGRQCHARRKQFEANLARAGLGDLKRRLYRSFAELGLGREVVLVARRPE